jgi:hypothetical protein
MDVGEARRTRKPAGAGLGVNPSEARRGARALTNQASTSGLGEAERTRNEVPAGCTSFVVSVDQVLVYLDHLVVYVDELLVSVDEKSSALSRQAGTRPHALVTLDRDAGIGARNPVAELRKLVNAYEALVDREQLLVSVDEPLVYRDQPA